MIKTVTEAFLRLALPLLNVDADDDDGQVGIWKAPLPLGTAELKTRFGEGGGGVL